MIKDNRIICSVAYIAALVFAVYYVFAGPLLNLGIDIGLFFFFETPDGLTNTPAVIPSLLVLAFYYLPDPIHSDDSIVNLVRLAETILFVGLFFITQFFYVRLSSRFSGKSVPNNKTGIILISSFQTMLLTLGIIATVLDVPFDNTSMYCSSCELTAFSISIDVAIVASVWLACFIAYYRLFQKDNSSAIIASLPHKLFLISMILVPLAALVMMLQGNKNYMIQGSYTGLVFGITILLWSFGVKLRANKSTVLFS